ncbi:MAG: hypothetical protein R3Y54_08330 [Eubacteriales bacterium]
MNSNKRRMKSVAIIALQIIFLVICNYRLFEPIDEIVISSISLYEQNQNANIVYAENGNILVQSDGEQIALRSHSFNLQPGAYHVNMDYQSDTDGSGSITQSTGTLLFYSEGGEAGMIVDESALIDGKVLLDTRLMIQRPSEMKDVFLVVLYEGVGVLEIGEIRILESMNYRLTQLLSTIIIFFVLNAIYFGVMPEKNYSEERIKRYLQMGAIVFFASLPLFANFMFIGHDSYFHLGRITMLAQELEYGQFPVRITRDYFMNRYGYVNPLFYCDLFLYLPAFLYNCMLPLMTCYAIYVISVNMFTVVIAYYSFKVITNDSKISLAGATIYTLGFYRIVCIYTRVAVGEYTATMFLPLIVAGMYTIYTKERIKYKDWILLSIGMSGIILSHILTTELTIVTLVIFCMFTFKRTLQYHRIVAILKAAGTTILLTAWFVVPMIQSMSMDLVVLRGSNAKIQEDGLYLAQLLGISSSGAFGSSIPNSMRDMPIAIGFGLLIGLTYAIYCFMSEKEWGITRVVIYQTMKYLFVLACISMVLTLRVFPWDSIEYLVGSDVSMVVSKIQFPWRYLTIATILTATVAVTALWLIKKYKVEYYKMATILILLCSVVTTGNYYADYISNAPTYTGAGIYYGETLGITNSEYRIEGINSTIMNMSAVHVDTSALVVERYEQVKGDTHITIHNTSDGSVQLTIPVQHYDNFVLRDSVTEEVVDLTTSEFQCISVQVPAQYEGTLVLTYEPPIMWRITEVISFVTLIVVSVGLAYKKRGENGENGEHQTLCS